MKKVGNWWVPEYESFKQVLDRIENETWTCNEPLDKSFSLLGNFGTALDIGAWIGDSTFILAKRFKNVIAFEPNVDVYECCLKNLRDKNVKNVTVHNFGLSDKEGQQKFLFPVSTQSAWIDTLEQSQEKPMIINTKTLDSYNFRNIDFIKIDVDSHEGYLLQGSRDFFKNNNPLVMIEHKPKTLKRQNHKMPNALEFLQDIGYKLVEQVTKIDYIFIRR